jgi:hypothetical protein
LNLYKKQSGSKVLKNTLRVLEDKGKTSLYCSNNQQASIEDLPYAKQVHPDTRNETNITNLKITSRPSFAFASLHQDLLSSQWCMQFFLIS